MKNRLCAMVWFFISIATVLGEVPPDIARLFTPEKALILEKNGELTAIVRENGKLTHLPDLPFSTVIAEKIESMKPTFAVEVCLLHQLQGIKTDTPESLRKIYNTLLSVSTLKGILYYSESRKTMREFFHDAYRIPSPEKRERLEDLRMEGAIPTDSSIFTFQNDSSFGENTFQVSYRYSGRSFLMAMQNVNQIWYGILPIVDPGNLIYYILVYPSGEYLMFYSVICVKGANPFGIMESKAASFYNRIKALDVWFRGQSGF